MSNGALVTHIVEPWYAWSPQEDHGMSVISSDIVM